MLINRPPTGWRHYRSALGMADALGGRHGPNQKLQLQCPAFCITICFSSYFYDRIGRVARRGGLTGRGRLAKMHQYVKLRIQDIFPLVCGFSTTGVAVQTLGVTSGQEVILTLLSGGQTAYYRHAQGPLQRAAVARKGRAEYYLFTF